MSVSTSAAPSVVKCGLLQKQGGVRQNFEVSLCLLPINLSLAVLVIQLQVLKNCLAVTTQTRFFVLLSNGQFTYYERESASTPGTGGSFVSLRRLGYFFCFTVFHPSLLLDND
jgi:hypothetical protein